MAVWPQSEPAQDLVARLNSGDRRTGNVGPNSWPKWESSCSHVPTRTSQTPTAVTLTRMGTAGLGVRGQAGHWRSRAHRPQMPVPDRAMSRKLGVLRLDSSDADEVEARGGSVVATVSAPGR